MKDYYATVRDGPRTGFLLGPYKTHIEAIYSVKRGKSLALQANYGAAFYAYGTASVPAGTKIKSVFGL